MVFIFWKEKLFFIISYILWVILNILDEELYESVKNVGLQYPSYEVKEKAIELLDRGRVRNKDRYNINTPFLWYHFLKFGLERL